MRSFIDSKIHAQSDNNVFQLKTESDEQFENERSEDAPLTKKGHLQSRVLASYLDYRKIYPNKIFTSFHIRALQTAQYLQDRFQVDVQVLKNIGEVGKIYCQGKGLPGVDKQYLENNHPKYQYNQNEMTEKGWNEYEFQETYEQASQRAKETANFLSAYLLDQSLQYNNLPNFYIISHGKYIDLLLGHIIGRASNPDKNCHLFHSNTGITKLQLNSKGRYFLRYMNEQVHLDSQDFDVLLKQEVDNFEGRISADI